MKCNDALQTLRAQQPLLESLGINALFLFGSVARDEAGEHSDVNLLAAPAGGQFTFPALMNVQDACRRALGKRADIQDYEAYRALDEFRERIEADLKRVF